MMKKRYYLFWLLALCASVTRAAENPVVDIETNRGTITVELAPDKSPLTVTNFLSYVNEGFYENTLFHRVIANFMIQGGGFTKDLKQKTTHAPIKLESNNGLSHLRGTIAMARTSVPDSATSQFFINSVDNQFLDYQNVNNPGYAVFGRVIEGLNVVDNISAVATSTAATTKDLPLQAVIINAARVRQAQLGFTGVKSVYNPGEILKVILQETKITRSRALDLWVAVMMPDASLLFASPEIPGFFGSQAKPFKRQVSLTETTHTVFSLAVPKGMTGKYTVYALFNEPGQSVNDLSHSLRSNLANAAFSFK